MCKRSMALKLHVSAAAAATTTALTAATFVFCAVIICSNVTPTHGVLSSKVLLDQCGHTLVKPSGFLDRHFDWVFLKKFFTHWNPFTSRARVKMHFYLYKRHFPECGREIITDDDPTLLSSGFNALHPTRIIIHGWMSQSKGSFNRAVKNAYLSLTSPPATTRIDVNTDAAAVAAATEQHVTVTNATTEGPSIIAAADSKTAQETATTTTTTTRKPIVETTESGNTPADCDYNIDGNYNYNYNYNDNDNDNDNNANVYVSADVISDYNVIVVDWSLISSNMNYFSVVDLIEDLGFLLAEFVRYLHLRTGLHYNDIYLIGHSLGAQIAGSAGKQAHPFRFNTIFALDPAGPKFRERSDEYRIDPTDAEYVESIQTSSSLGFEEPVGHATFYPNFGRQQKKCYIYGCSHSRAYNYFAESITSKKGFWGTLCKRESEDVWILSDSGAEFRMGGEPSLPKRGTFYVKTSGKSPYALGRRISRLEEESTTIETLTEKAPLAIIYV